MTTVGIIDRLMRSSVDRAIAMQPRRTRRLADEYLYAAPVARPAVEAIRSAGRRLVASGLASTALGGVAVRKSDRSVTRVIPGSDLTAVDARHLETAAASPGDPLAWAAASVGAAVLAHPVSLLAVSTTVGLDALDRAAGGLWSISGEIGTSGTPTAEGVWVVPGVGVIAADRDPDGAVTRLEAAERLASITLATREH